MNAVESALLQARESLPDRVARRLLRFAALCGASRAVVAELHLIENEESPSIRLSQHAISNFIHRVFANFTAAAQAECPAGAREKQPHVIVNLCCGRHRRARIPRRVLLADRDCRGDADDLVHIGLLDSIEKLPRVG